MCGCVVLWFCVSISLVRCLFFKEWSDDYKNMKHPMLCLLVLVCTMYPPTPARYSLFLRAASLHVSP